MFRTITVFIAFSELIGIYEQGEGAYQILNTLNPHCREWDSLRILPSETRERNNYVKHPNRMYKSY